MASPNTAEPIATPVVNTGKTSKTIGYYLTFIALGMVGAALGPTLPGLAAQTGSAISQISFLFSARSLGYLVGSFGVARLYDHLRGHPILGVSLLGMAVMMALVPLAPLLWLLVAVMLVLGITEGTIDVGTNTLLVWVHKPNVGPYMNALHFFFGVGAFLSPLIVGQLLRISRSVSLPYWTLAALIAPVGLLVLLLSSPVNLDLQAEGGVRKVNPLLIVLLAALFFLYVGAEVGYGGWVYTFTIRMNLANETSAALLTSLFWGGLTAGRLLSIPIAARVPARWILLADLLGCILSLLVILFLPFPTIAIWTGTVGIGLSMASIFPTLLAFAERRMSISGKVTGYFFVGASLGSMLLPLLIGRLFEPLGPRSAMVVILLDLLAAVLIYGVLMLYARKTR